MYRITPLEPIDYLIIGHLTRDLTPDGPRLGGTASYASLTARALGLRVGILTACEDCLSTPVLEQAGIRVVGTRASETTTFENIQTPNGRIQYVHKIAPTIDLSMVPEPWLNTPIVHLGPIAREVDPMLVRAFPSAFVGLTPQGWMRSWDKDGRVFFSEWPESSFVLQHADAAVLSIEDVRGNEAIIDDMASSARVLRCNGRGQRRTVILEWRCPPLPPAENGRDRRNRRRRYFCYRLLFPAFSNPRSMGSRTFCHKPGGLFCAKVWFRGCTDPRGSSNLHD